MDNLQFIQRLYNGKNCYSDSMTSEQINLLHVPSGVEAIIKKMVSEKRIVFFYFADFGWKIYQRNFYNVSYIVSHV